MSQDNININVQETNDIVNIVSSEVTEVIDINVGETIEEVTLNITEEIIQVNINKVTGGGLVTSVNGLIGDVVLDIPTATSDLTNDSNFISDASYVHTDNNYTTTEKNKLAGIAAGAEVNVNADWNATTGDAQILNKPTIPDVSGFATTTYVDAQDALKVDKVTGYSLTKNDFTDTLKSKLDGIAAGAEVNVNADWNATTGDAVILNKPTIPSISGLATITYVDAQDDLKEDYLSVPAADGYVLSSTTAGVRSWIAQSGGGGGGDMLKSTYDVDNTGIVDNAEAIKIIGRNSTGSTLYKGTIIYISGSTGNRPNFVKARANGEATSAGTFGVIADDLANNADGYALCLGYLDNLDTRTTATHPFTADILADGDTIYLSPDTAGYITNIKPSAPNHLVYLGKVTRTSPTNGTIVYRIQNGYELEELHNVAISSVADKQLLSYDGATSLWKNKSVTTADIADSTNKRYVTDANLTTIGNQSGTNTGDETTATIKSKLGITTLSGSNTGDQDLSGLVIKNATITGATKTKITYDSKGLVTNGADATTADIADSTNKRYVTDANLTIIGNTSGTNTGDNAVNSLYSGLSTSKQDTLVSGTNIKTINSTSLLGSGNIAVQPNLVSGTNIKTINGNSILGSGDLTISGGISGSGTTNYIPKFTGTSAVGNSNIYDDGTNIGIGQTTPTAKLDVNGDALINGITVGRGAGNDFSNTIVGYASFSSNLYGQENVIVGYSSGTNITNAVGNVILGKGAGGNLYSGVGNTIIGTGNSLNPNNNAVDFNDTLSISKRNSANNTYLPHIWCPEKSNTDATTSIISLSALYYGAMFVEYVIEDTLGNMRAGYIKGVWLTDMSSIKMTEETTSSIGDTNNYTFNIVDEGSGNIALQITSAVGEMIFLNISSRLLNRPYTI